MLHDTHQPEHSADDAKSWCVAGCRLEHLRAMSGGAHVVRLTRRMMRAEARETARLLQTDPEILSIEPDLVLQPMATPNDPYFAQQWHYHEPAGGINLPAAWDVTTGSNAITALQLRHCTMRRSDCHPRNSSGSSRSVRTRSIS